MYTDYNDSLALKTLYYSLVQSKFEYASLIWLTVSILQNQFLISIKKTIF